MDNTMEMGGYLPLEISYLGEKNNELFSEIDERHKIRFNAARYAICYAVQEGNYKKIYIPLYMCAFVAETIDSLGIIYETYSIDRQFYPLLREIDNEACILICNYFGMQGDDFYRKCIGKYKNVIFDNTQALYYPPIIEDNVYNIYSVRKFVGCIDGAYLIKKNVIKEDFPTSESWMHSDFLMKSIEGGTNYAYALYLKSEEAISKQGMRKMSILTQRYLDALQYKKLKEIRKLNFQYLDNKLTDFNKIQIKRNSDVYPMVYPLLPKNRIDRMALIQRKIYIPQWWKWVIEQSKATAWEIELSKYLFALPIDHRYNENDMERLVSIIKDLISIG